jgi:hypothetical protein
MNIDYLNFGKKSDADIMKVAVLMFAGGKKFFSEQLKMTCDGIVITPSTGDRITRFLIGMIDRVGDFAEYLKSEEYWQAVGVSGIGLDVERLVTCPVDAAKAKLERGGQTSIQDANHAMAKFLTRTPQGIKYDNRSSSSKIYLPPMPEKVGYEKIISRQLVMQKLFKSIATEIAEQAKLKDNEEAWGKKIDGLLVPPQQNAVMSENPAVSFLLVGNVKEDYTLDKSNVEPLVKCLWSWRGRGDGGRFYVLNFKDRPDKFTDKELKGVEVVVLDHKLGDSAGLQDSPIGELSRAIDVIRRAAEFEAKNGRALVVVSVQSGFWYHAQYSGAPTLTLTPNEIPKKPEDEKTKLDAELERSHVHLSVRCVVPNFLAKKSGWGKEEKEFQVVHAALDGLVTSHPVFSS